MRCHEVVFGGNMCSALQCDAAQYRLIPAARRLELPSLSRVEATWEGSLYPSVAPNCHIPREIGSVGIGGVGGSVDYFGRSEGRVSESRAGRGFQNYENEKRRRWKRE